MKFLWELLLRGDVCTPRIQPYLSYELEDVISSFSEDDLLASQVRQLREHLRPMLAINEKFDWGDLESECETQAVDDFVHVEIVLSTEGAIDVIRDLSDEEMGKILSSDFLRLYDSILHEIVSILKRIGRNVDIRDPSVLTMPSISKHEQNRGYTDWVVIIELLRDSWLQMNQTNPDEAAEIIRKWHEAPFRTFKRLCLFGAANSKVLQPEEWLKWLEKDNLLWASDMKREVCRLIELN